MFFRRASSPRKASASRRVRKGIAVTELAIGLPVVLLVAMSTMEICTMIRLRQKIRMVAFEGARVGVLPKTQAANVDWQCSVLCTDQSIASASVVMTPGDPTTLASGDWFEVSVEAPFTANSLTGAWLANGFVLNESVSLQKP